MISLVQTLKLENQLPQVSAGESYFGQKNAQKKTFLISGVYSLCMP